MPNTNAPAASPDNLTDIKERHFLLDYVERSTEASEGITTVLDTIEANERYQSKPQPDNAEAQALALSAHSCNALQKLALLSARLLGSHAVQEVELMHGRERT